LDLREKYGQTFVIVTHDEELAKITDRTIHIKDGMVYSDGIITKEEIIDGETETRTVE
jgi:lipoprotein-releasing system ATP-binding protein